MVSLIMGLILLLIGLLPYIVGIQDVMTSRED